MMSRAVTREKSQKVTGQKVPVVVDKEGVIVIGHERYYALTKMGKKINAEAYDIPEDKAAKYRMVDCRVSPQNPSVRLKPFYKEITTLYDKVVTKKKNVTKKVQGTKSKS